MKKIIYVFNLIISLFCFSCAATREEGYIELAELYKNNYNEIIDEELKYELSALFPKEIRCLFIHKDDIEKEYYNFWKDLYGFDFVSFIIPEVTYGETNEKKYMSLYILEFKSKSYAEKIYEEFFSSQPMFNILNNIIFIETASSALFFGEETIEIHNVLYNKNQRVLMRAFNQTGEVIIPKNVTTIENLAFRNNNYINNNNVTKLICNKSLKRIGTASFYGNNNLKYIEFNDGLEYIGLYAFAECEIEYVVIPKSVIFIGDNAFTNGKIFCEAERKLFYWSDIFAVEDAKVYWKNDWKYDESGKPVVIGNL